jgi:hypothetical protein
MNILHEYYNIKYNICNGHYRLYFTVGRKIIMRKVGTTINEALLEGQINRMLNRIVRIRKRNTEGTPDSILNKNDANKGLN